MSIQARSGQVSERLFNEEKSVSASGRAMCNAASAIVLSVATALAAAQGTSTMRPAAAAAAPGSSAAAAPEVGCQQPLDVCTRERIEALKTQSRQLTAAARQRPAASLTIEEREKVQEYDRWLRAQARRTRELADRGAAATTRETQLGFNQQFLALQSQMQQENRSYTAISNIMKTKHDTAKNSISNVR
jgi:hypothetical protein